MKKRTLKAILTNLIIPLILSISSILIISNLNEKFRNPYYKKLKTTHSGGLIIKGIPIPLAVKKEKKQPYTEDQIRAIKAEFGENVRISNITRNKKWYKYQGLRSFLSITGWLFGIIFIFESIDYVKRFINSE